MIFQCHLLKRFQSVKTMALIFLEDISKAFAIQKITWLASADDRTWLHVRQRHRRNGQQTGWLTGEIYYALELITNWCIVSNGVRQLLLSNRFVTEGTLPVLAGRRCNGRRWTNRVRAVLERTSSGPHHFRIVTFYPL